MTSHAAGDIFIVDDTPANLGLLAAILREAGYSVRVANSGRLALRALQGKLPELILLDINMPDMNGFEVCAALKADARTREVPVIFLSALDDVRDKVQAFRAGGIDYVTKPFQAEEVVVRVETQLSLGRMRRMLQTQNRELALQNAALAAARAAADQIFGALTDVLAGSVIAERYQLERKIGTGGTAGVYEAVDLVEGRRVAVKVLRPQLRADVSRGDAGTGPQQSPVGDRRARLAAAEQDIAGRVAHPNAVVVHRAGRTDAGISYLVMELLTGRSLADELDDIGRLTFARCAEVFSPVAEVLERAHAIGVVHRDIKPANIFLHEDANGEIVKVIDFGIARLELDDDAGRTGAMTGTPFYMAPERLLGEAYDGRADVYAFGVTLYQALAGGVPWPVPESLARLILSCLHDEPTPLAALRVDIPAGLATLVMRMLAKRASDRPTMAKVSVLLSEELAAASDQAFAATPEDGARQAHGMASTLSDDPTW